MFKSTVESLFSGMDGFLNTKTVVGDAIHIGDTIILPLVEVTFGIGAGSFDKSPKGSSAGGGVGGKIAPSAVLVITNGTTRLISVKNGGGFDKVLDMVPDFVSKFADKKSSGSSDRSDEEAVKVLEETITAASKVDKED